jgi:hypothetical protein
MPIENKLYKQRATHRFLALMQKGELPDTASQELRELLRDIMTGEVTARGFHENLNRLINETIEEIDADEGLQINMSF